MRVLPVSGFVLAGGKSSRMGVDKAGLMLGGRSLVELAVGKLAGICAEVAIVGNRDEFAHVAPVVTERRLDVGPGAGIEAGLRAARQEWCLFVPVDVPLLPVELLRCWAEAVLAAEKKGMRASYLFANEQPQPSICMLHRSCLKAVTEALDADERRIRYLFTKIDAEFGAGSVLVQNAGACAQEATGEDLERWFLNVNTPEELAKAERLVAGGPVEFES